MCILLREARGPGTWRGRRSVEVIGFHDEEERMNALFALYLTNCWEDGKDNYLYILHPGNVKFDPVYSPWPRTYHRDEHDRTGSSILASVYGEAFTYDESVDTLYQTSALSAWDSWFGWKREPVTIWPRQEEGLNNENCIREEFPTIKKDKSDPFTEVRLGPFWKKQSVLIFFYLTLEGESYKKLIKEEAIFVADGPERLLLRINDYIGELDVTEQSDWYEHIEPFKEYLSFGESYDIILIKEPNADDVVCVWPSGIVKGPIQPSCSTAAARYITPNNNFALYLKYAIPDKVVHESKASQTDRAM